MFKILRKILKKEEDPRQTIPLHSTDKFLFYKEFYFKDTVNFDFLHSLEHDIHGKDPNPVLCAKWCLSSAQKGCVYAFYNYGLMAYEGYGCDKSLKSAHFWIKKACREGFEPAMVVLGRWYLQGVSFSGEDFKIQKDKKRALKMFERASFGKYGPAFFELGRCYEKDGMFKRGNNRDSFQFYLQAAQYDCVKAMTKVGMLYLHGIGVDRNGLQAIYWLESAAKLGCAEAAYSLGSIYYGTPGFLTFDVDCDKDLGIYWLKESLRLGCLKGCRELGFFYRDFTSNKTMAYACLQIASADIPKIKKSASILLDQMKVKERVSAYYYIKIIKNNAQQNLLP